MMCVWFPDKVQVRCPYAIHLYLYDNKLRVSIILWLLGGSHISAETKSNFVDIAPLLWYDDKEMIKENYSA